MTTLIPAPGEIRPDAANSDCAACGMPAMAVEGRRTQRQGVKLNDEAHVLIMLCLDGPACCNRYRGGLRPAGYAALLRSGAKP